MPTFISVGLVNMAVFTGPYMSGDAVGTIAGNLLVGLSA
jgi:hypothetical protein